MTTKRITPYLKKGDTVRAEVRECLRDGYLIVNFEGDLLNVRNQTHRPLVAGDVISLQVISAEPLTFKMIREPERQGFWQA